MQWSRATSSTRWVQHWRLDHRASTDLGGGRDGLACPRRWAREACIEGAPDAQICVSGDGSIMMNIQELATLKRYRLPVKIVLLDNQALGMVRQWQELFFEKRYSEIDLSDNPDFAAVAAAFGIQAFHGSGGRCRSRTACLLAADGPAFLHVAIDTAAIVRRWSPNRSNAEMMDDTRWTPSRPRHLTRSRTLPMRYQLDLDPVVPSARCACWAPPSARLPAGPHERRCARTATTGSCG
jgi:thiamine pyrophosphate-dependent acetolactate synthase large subunit-like protein